MYHALYDANKITVKSDLSNAQEKWNLVKEIGISRDQLKND